MMQALPSRHGLQVGHSTQRGAATLQSPRTAWAGRLGGREFWPHTTTTKPIQRISVQTKVATVQGKRSGQKEDYDVYVSSQEPLQEGEEKHVISVFVADESGLINRVAGVFARRGANIESLAVGLSQDKALFTIVVAGTASMVANLVKQLGKLVKVRYVEDITNQRRMDRELILVKVNAPEGPARTEVLQLGEIFRARVVDVAERSLTLCMSGDPGKTMAMQQVMGKFGILEIARTGRISLKRGDKLLENIRAPGERVPRQPKASSLRGLALRSREADVYMVDDAEASGVWDVDNILEPPSYTSGEAAPSTRFEPHTLSCQVLDIPGVLQQVTSVFARRGYNVQSLAVGPSEKDGQSRITMVIPGSEDSIQNLLKQIKKLVNVQDAADVSSGPFVARELMLIKVVCSPEQRAELQNLASIFRANIVDVSSTTVTVEAQGRFDKLQSLGDLLAPYGVLEVARTGRIALTRASGVDTRYLEKRRSRPVW